MHPQADKKLDGTVIGIFALITSLSLAMAWHTEFIPFAIIPIAILLIYLGFTNIKAVYWMLLFLLPCSIEFYFSNSLGTDLPTEPLMIALLLLSIFYVFKNPKEIDAGLLKNYITAFLAIHVFWIFIASLNSENPLHSFKFFAAKTWYMASFYLLTYLFLRSEQDFKKWFWLIFTPLLVLTIVTLIRYIPYHFDFDAVNKTMVPYFRNKVNYGTMLSIFLPFLFLAAKWYAPGSFQKRLINFGKIVLLTGIYFSYTRACILALVIGLGSIFIIRHRFIKPAIVLALIALTAFVFKMHEKNKFMSYAPDFEKTVQHDNFDEHLEATVKFEDVSSMERIYMWLGGVRLFLESPVMGHGPGTFYPIYKKYTISSFETYISDNEDKLTVHNYYLLTLIEQGLVGFIILIALLSSVLIYGQNLYHRAKTPFIKRATLAVTVSFVMIMVSLFLSDLVEVDKTGSIFFMDMAMLLALNRMNKVESAENING